MILIAGDNGVFSLAHIADLGEDLADFVVLLNSLADGLIGSVDTELLLQVIQNVDLHLGCVSIEGVVGHLERNVHVGYKELLLRVDLQNLEVLHCAVHHGACVYTDHCVEELIAALDSTLYECACVLAGVVGHVVGRDVDRTCLRCAQTHGETVAYVEKCFGNMIAGIAKADIALSLSLLYQLVVGILKKTFEVDQMLKIFHFLASFIKEFLTISSCRHPMRAR